jgi:hypothetical protein
MRTLFLHPPSFDGFDGGAGARYQAKREIRSFWFPTWLAQPAALIPGSKLIDAPADGTPIEQILAEAVNYDLIVMHTSAPSFLKDAHVAELLKKENPRLLIGMVGAQVAVDPTGSLTASTAIDFVAREEFDYTCKDVADGRSLDGIAGLSFRRADGSLQHNPPREMIEDMDALPWVAPIYKRDLKIENYFIGYLKHPYVSIYTGRGCRSKCTFCLWPQTVGGHRYRVRSPQNVVDEVRWIKENMPEVKEIFFDDDTFTDFRPRAEEIARGLGKLGVTWSCNAKANVPYETLRVMRENGLRLLLVGYESGNDQILHNIRKGLRTDIARERLRRPSERRSSSRWTSIRTPSRCRSPPPIRAPSSTARPSRTVGSPRTAARAWSTARACSSHRSAIPISARPRSTGRWRSSTAASTSGRARSSNSRRR